MVRALMDATALPENRGGVGRYVDQLLAHLSALGLDVHVAAQRRDEQLYVDLLGTDRVHLAPRWAIRTAPRLAWEQIGLPLLARRVGADLLHSPHYTLPLMSTLVSHPRQVVTLHDATFFSHPELHIRTKARFFAAWTKVATRRADALVVPSQATKDELARYTGADLGTFTVIPHGVDHTRFRPPTEDEVRRVREWLGLAAHTAYIASLGTLEPRKNLPALIRGYAAACGSLAAPPTLVLAGGKGWDTGIRAALAEVPSHLTVLVPGFVPDPLIPPLLGGAAVVAYPALGEGFGLPVLEAMACGAAVLTTRMLSLPEVGGDAVAYAESPDWDDIATALVGLLADPHLRTRLGRDGVSRAAGFTWALSAAAHAKLYNGLTC